MKIRNIDALKHLTSKVLHLDIPQFALDVIRPLEREMLREMLMRPCPSDKTDLPLIPPLEFENFDYEQIANLVHTIPIYLRDVRPEEYNRETDIVDLLGAYFPNRKNDYPYIELYLSEIDNASGSNDLVFKWLFTTVLIHELAHAALDIFNHKHYNQMVEKVQYCTEFGKWREESMANAVALRIIREYGNQDFYEYAKSFMLSQPDEYALGVLMENFGYWDFRSVTDGKKYGVHQDLQQKWLDYVKGNPTWKELERWNEILSDRIVYIFNKRYYTDHQDLVLDIIQDYLAKKGQLSFSQLCSVFPNVRVQSKEAYRPLSSVLNDSQYFTNNNQVLHLLDGDYAIYKYWYNNDLESILSIATKEGFIIDTLNNY